MTTPRRLLIHHHAVAFVDRDGRIWLPSFIARWVDALAEHVEELLLLLHESPARLSAQDECIGAPNVRVVSMGPPGKFWDRLPRMRRIVAACRAGAAQADALLVRGVTPRQYTVWNNVDVPRKAFLLVGSVATPPPVEVRRFASLHAYLMFHHRRRELKKMAGTGVLLANSPTIVSELAALTSSPVRFVPTSSIRKSEFPPVEVRPVARPARLLFCGRVTVQKGIFELLAAVRTLNREKFPCCLDLVGPMSLEAGAQVNAALERLDLRDQVTLHGRIPYGPRMFEFYGKADLFVLPSYTEGFPHVLWEAAANACPVVCTKIPSIEAMWTDGEHAVMVPVRDAAALSRGIRAVLEDEPLRRHLILNSYARASAFHVEACAARAMQTLSEQWR